MPAAEARARFPHRAARFDDIGRNFSNRSGEFIKGIREPRGMFPFMPVPRCLALLFISIERRLDPANLSISSGS